MMAPITMITRQLGRQRVQLIVAFVLGFVLSSAYFHLSSDDVLIYQSVGIRSSVTNTSPDQQRPLSNNENLPIKHNPPIKQRKKILLDCGANTASTVQLFRETYPGGHDFIIHSFEIDDRLAPYFAPYANHVLHCPLAVSDKNGTMISYSESSWSPNKGMNNGADMQWGGGTLFVDRDEKRNEQTGGRRKLSVRKEVPTVDLSDWIKQHTTKDDYVIFKLDVEGAEFGILDKMMWDGTFEWIDKFYGEYHIGKPTNRGRLSQWLTALNVKLRGKSMLNWVGEKRTYEDFDIMHPITQTEVSRSPGQLRSTCYTHNHLAIVLLMSMNAKQSQKLAAIVEAYRKRLPITLFLYGDFVELFPDVVQSWSKQDNLKIGIRGNYQYPTGHLEKMSTNWIRECVVSTQMRLSELQIQTSFYLPTGISPNVISVAKSQGLTIIQPSAAFPPLNGTLMDYNNYYKYRDVERIPKALRMLHEQLLQSEGGILALDTDLPDTHLIIVFLLDYLVDNSGYEIVPLEKCIGK
ncbi:uncharacterized protein [Amphiura filiformis]|uniref:uncharacterized protein n=1 Tax=Amphiura filiformis TaxID=82378 RepID=UPI003B2138E5